MLAVPQGTIELIEQRQACLRLTARGAQPVAIFGVKLRESDGGPFFHKLVQTNAPRTRKCFEPSRTDLIGILTIASS